MKDYEDEAFEDIEKAQQRRAVIENKKDAALRLARYAFKEIADETYDSWTNGAKAQRIAQAMIPKLDEALEDV
jgi:hypothetical protein